MWFHLNVFFHYRVLNRFENTDVHARNRTRDLPFKKGHHLNRQCSGYLRQFLNQNCIKPLAIALVVYEYDDFRGYPIGPLFTGARATPRGRRFCNRTRSVMYREYGNVIDRRILCHQRWFQLDSRYWRNWNVYKIWARVFAVINSIFIKLSWIVLASSHTTHDQKTSAQIHVSSTRGPKTNRTLRTNEFPSLS